MVHTTTALVFAAVALNAASTLATPLNPVTTEQTRELTEIEQRTIQEVSQVLGRDLTEIEQRGVVSGLMKAAPYVAAALPLAEPAFNWLKDKFTGKRELEELLGRELSEVEERDFLSNFGQYVGGRLSQKRELEEVFERGLTLNSGIFGGQPSARVGSQPFGAGHLASKILPQSKRGLFATTPPASHPLFRTQRRELEEILGRELTEVEQRGVMSGLLKAAPYVAAALPLAEPAFNWVKDKFSGKRELEELLGRELTEIEERGVMSGLLKAAPYVAAALPLAEPAFNWVKDKFSGKRELEELLGRELTEVEERGVMSGLLKAAPYAAAALPLAEPAFNWIKNKFTGKRELEEILGRELTEIEVRALELDQLD